VPLIITEGTRKADSAVTIGLCAGALSGVASWHRLPDWNDLPVKNRDVVIIFDSDAMTKRAVWRELKNLKEWLETHCAHVRIVYLPPGLHGEKVGLDDYILARLSEGLTDEEIRDRIVALATDELRPMAASAKETKSGLPEIFITKQRIRDLTQAALEAIQQANAKEPQVFNRSGVLVRLSTEDDLRVDPFGIDSLRGHLDRIADFVTIDDKGDTQPADPPLKMVKDLLARPAYPFAKLDAVELTPFFDSSCGLVVAQGYHPDPRTYLHLDGLVVPAIPDRPVASDLAHAKALLFDELLGDFPFTDQSSRAYAITPLIYSFARQVVGAPAPLTGIDSPKEGTGKGLLASILGHVTTGRPITSVTDTQNAEELRKRITSLLMASAPIAMFDNVSAKLASGVLASLLTDDEWSDRVMGGNRMLSLKNRTVWLVSGNNLRFSGELARRTIRIRLDAQVEHPNLRSPQSFRHADLRGWVRGNRGQLIAAVLTLIRHWKVSGCQPFTTRTLGSFESWTRIVGGVLEAAEIPGFLTDREAFQSSADDLNAPWRAFVEAWAGSYGDRAVTAGELFSIAMGHLAAIKADDRANRTRLGGLLMQRRDSIIAGWKVVSAEAKDEKGRLRAGWKLAKPEPYGYQAQNFPENADRGWEVGENEDSLIKLDTYLPQPDRQSQNKVGEANPVRTKGIFDIPKLPNLDGRFSENSDAEYAPNVETGDPTEDGVDI